MVKTGSCIGKTREFTMRIRQIFQIWKYFRESRIRNVPVNISGIYVLIHLEDGLKYVIYMICKNGLKWAQISSYSEFGLKLKWD